MLTLTYKNVSGVTDFDWLELRWVGHTIKTDDAVGFEGMTVDEAERNFYAVVDAYYRAANEELAEAA